VGPEAARAVGAFGAAGGIAVAAYADGGGKLCLSTLRAPTGYPDFAAEI